MKKIVVFLMGLVMVLGIFVSVANFLSADLSAQPWHHKGTYAEISGHGWMCTGAATDCAVGGPD